MTPEIICGLLFYTPSRNMEDYINIGELLDNLTSIEDSHNLGSIDDCCIKLMCKILNKIPLDMVMKDLLERLN